MTRLINVHEAHHGNEIRDWAYEQLAALPPAPGYAGRNVQVGDNYYYGINATTWRRVITDSEFAMAQRFVGVISAAAGAVPLATPTVDPVDGTTNWSLGDRAVIGTAGVLTGVSYGDPNVNIGDEVVCIQVPPTGNGSFMVVDGNPPASTPLNHQIVVVNPGDWVALGPGLWEVTVVFANGASEVVGAPSALNLTTELVEVFDVNYWAGKIRLQANGAAAPVDPYRLSYVLNQ
jgi:hypothetical protein